MGKGALCPRLTSRLPSACMVSIVAGSGISWGCIGKASITLTPVPVCPLVFSQHPTSSTSLPPLHWIMVTNYRAVLIHFLDDFLLAGPPGQPTCSESMETMLRYTVCERLSIPVALDKLEGPATSITFLGITIDTTLQQLRLPPDQLEEMVLLILAGEAQGHKMRPIFTYWQVVLCCQSWVASSSVG